MLDIELAALAAAYPHVRVEPVPLTHSGPAWAAIDDVIDVIEAVLASTAPSPLRRAGPLVDAAQPSEPLVESASDSNWPG